MFSKFFFFHLWGNVEKFCRAEETTDKNMSHDHFMPDTYDYKETLRICNTIHFPLQR